MTNTQTKFRCFSLTLALLAMSLSFFAQIAPLWAKQADGTPLVICSAFGEQTIYLDEDGQRLPDSPAPKPLKSHCALCFVSGSNYILTDSIRIDFAFEYLKNSPIQKNSSFERAEAVITANSIRAPPVSL